jgi:5-(carboxyamino)imidazole ribonucleotide synthase
MVEGAGADGSRSRVGAIGILGGGQLGRMLCVAASRLGLGTVVLAPEPDAVAGQVASSLIRARYDDTEALVRLAQAADAVTYEFENVPASALDVITAEGCPVRPSGRALAVAQDRKREKDFVTGLGLATAPYAAVSSTVEIGTALDVVGLPAIIKTRRFGYDGKGQRLVHSRDEAVAAWEAMGSVPCLAEGLVRFVCELSVIGARGIDGTVRCYEPGRNVHREGILRTTVVPSDTAPAVREAARALGTRILDALDYVGVLGIELFLTEGGELLVNELAPRVHNSGHWTQDGCVIDQFEQHVRAVAGWPLGDGRRHSDVVMTNLIGDEIETAGTLAAEPDVALHLYAKAEVRAGRKMGHANRVVGPARDDAPGSS